MSEMVERVASMIKDTLEQLGADHPYRWEAAAVGAILTLRDPTPEMIRAGTDADHIGDAESMAGWSIMPIWTEDFDSDRSGETKKLLPGIWHSMIDEALK